MSLLSSFRALLSGGLGTSADNDAHACLQVCQEPVGKARAPVKASGQLIVCERMIQTDAKIINWRDDPEYSAYYRCCYSGPKGARTDPHPFRPAQGMESRTARFRPRKELLGQRDDLATLQGVIRQLVIHHDGADSSADCFHILHDERGLSVHFLVDTDGTIYQTLDLADVAFHAQSVNGMSIGIELCNRGLVDLTCSAAHRRHREPRSTTIHGHEYQMWTFTDAQYHALAQLTAELGRIFNRLPLCHPRSGVEPIFTKLTEPERYSGLLGHYHVSAQKWDPGCFDFPKLLGMLPGRHLVAIGAPLRSPAASAGRSTALVDLLRAEAENPHGGFFPVGSCGTELVWHGGVHLALAAELPLAAQLGGKIVAARLQRAPTAYGSTNFVLSRHDMRVGAQTVAFFVLYYHLAPVLRPDSTPAWLRQPAAQKAAQTPLSGTGVFFPDADILAGEIIGRVGFAGPPGHHEPQIHLEVFAVEEVAQTLLPGLFRSKDCGVQGPLCSDAEVHALLAGPPARRHGSEDALRNAAKVRELRRLALRFPSEWTARSAADFDRGLRSTTTYRRAPPAVRYAVYCEQALPSGWLDLRAAQRLGLPPDLVVWHYHPVEFLSALAERAKPSRADAGIEAQADVGAAQGTAQDGAKSDAGYASDEDLAEWEMGTGAELTTEELASGFPSHWLR